MVAELAVSEEILSEGDLSWLLICKHDLSRCQNSFQIPQAVQHFYFTRLDEIIFRVRVMV